jgi:hypothetical protein
MTPRARNLLLGLFLLVLGIVISIASYDSAASSPSGGTYIVAIGPMAIGLRFILRGLFAKA